MLKLFYHPLASFCWKVQIALYENGTEFTGEIVNLADQAACAEFFSLWPLGKMPLLRDETRKRTVPETTIIIEYLDEHYPGARRLLPADRDQRLDARLWDRFFDLYVQVPMQKIVADRLRSNGEKDPRGVVEANVTLRTAYDVLEKQLARGPWVIGEHFGIADCAAMPGLFYANTLVPFTATHPKITAYFDRLEQRPSVRRVLEEARPFFPNYPFKEKLPARFL